MEVQNKPRVLFVCGSNSCRSQMATGFLRALGGERVEVLSAGITASHVHPLALRVMEEAGVDISHQTSKSLSQLEPTRFDLVITLCGVAREACFSPDTMKREERKKLFGGVPVYLHWGIPDPATAEGDEQQRLAVFSQARDEIRGRVEGLLEHGYLDAFTLERGRLQRFADMLVDGIIIHDEFRNIFLVNRALLEMTGRTREEIEGRDCHEVFPHSGLCGKSCLFQHGPSKGEARHVNEVRFTTDEGVNRLLKVTSEPMEIEPGKQGVLAVVRDLTEVKELQARLGEQRSFHGMVGGSRLVQEVYDTIKAVSTSDYAVLITGESGTGKELVAAAIHQESSRRDGPFVPVNCGALPENILESELFGHVRGAFTGAIRDKKGRFELAHKGTLFLDEIGELPRQVQVKLLRVLQEKNFERVGGERTIRVDVRIVAATNQDLQQMIRQGSFREDLYYRLCVVPIHLPTLHQRIEDLPLLVEALLARIRKESGKNVSGISNGALDLLRSHNWPGNIRELINALQYATIRCTDKVIQVEHLPAELRIVHAGALATTLQPATAQAMGPDADRQPATALSAIPDPTTRRRHKLTREAVKQALAEAGGKKVKAAKLLGVGRATLYRFLDRETDLR